jgi:hypothetical protein
MPGSIDNDNAALTANERPQRPEPVELRDRIRVPEVRMGMRESALWECVGKGALDEGHQFK